VVGVPDCVSRGPSSIPGATRFFWEVVGLELGPLSLMTTIDELLGRKSSGSGLENREYCCRDTSRWPRDALFLQKLAVTSPISGCRSVGIVCSWTKATELLLFIYHNSGHFPSSCLLFKTQLNSIGLSVPHRKHITSPLRAQQANAIYRFLTVVYYYNYHNFGHYPSPCLLFKRRRFWDRILSQSSRGTYPIGPNRKSYFLSPD
jgi:hypothetical protein